MAASSKRLQLEFKNASKEYAVEIIDDDLSKWSTVIVGPEGTPYEGGNFEMTISFPAGYPFSPPELSFDTQIYHPNITLDGKICLAMTKNGNWKPNYQAKAVLDAVHDLLLEPDFNDASVPELVKIWHDDKPRFVKMARSWTKKYAL
jgi:ubiquitin-conjugating enzyme E2 D/E